VKPLLDTHVLLRWLLEDKRLSRRQRRIIQEAGADSPLLVAGISLWEIATLHALGRIVLTMPLRDWLEQATAPPLVQVVGMDATVAAEVAALPPSFHRDPGDRIIVATCRVHGATLLTGDRRIIEAELVPTVS
jgi:PIN domain nuclease of toxin-antitoxin system